MKRFLYVFGGALLFAGRLLSAPCSPVSAAITYAADDRLRFYINGNQVLDGSVNNPGAPPVTASISAAFFNAAGVPNFFAAALVNTQANYVGGSWSITIDCADGSKSYVTNEDNSYLMYDDVSGLAPPPANWYAPTYVDSGMYFTQAPVLAAPIFWFNPVITHPLTGQPLQMLSHSASGIQSADAEILYFRQQVVLPVYSPTPTPSPVPTYPPGCGVPNFQEARVLASGCLGSTGTVTAPSSGSYSFTAQPNQLLVLRISTNSTSSSPSNVLWGAQPMTLFASSNVGSSDQNRMHGYYVVNPINSGVYSFSYPNANCSWNVVSELYNNVDVSNPVGGSPIKVGGNAAASAPYGFNFNFSTAGSASLVSIFITSDQIQNPSDKPLSSNLAIDMNLLTVGPSSVDGGGSEAVAGFYKAAYSPGSQAFSFTLNQANRWWDAQPMEIRGNDCSTPSPTPAITLPPTPPPTMPLSSPTATRTATPSTTRSATPSATPSATASPAFSPTLSFTATPSYSPGPSLTATPSYSLTPSPSQTFTQTPVLSPTPTRTPGLNFLQQGRLIQLKGLYPNPFSDVLKIYITLRVDSDVTLDIYNVAGEPIQQLRQASNAGKNLLEWKGENAGGGRCATGVYVLHLQAQGVDGTKDDFWERAAVAR